MLARAMRDTNDCRVLSFRYLYPQWLFPGQSDRDPEYDGHAEEGTEYLLDSRNPFTWARAVQRTTALRPNLVLIPWWTFFLGPMSSYIASRLRRKGLQVAFLCHNVLDHEEAAWKRALTARALKQGCRFIAHSPIEGARIGRLIGASEVTVHPHPVYAQFPLIEKRLAPRAGLELLFYGFVRPYKGLDVLVEAMGILKEDDVFLTIAGEFWEGERRIRARIASLQIQEKVEVRGHYHREEETAGLFTRADVIVLPYRSATSSGVVPLAYHYDRPVIVTAVGSLPEVVRDGETGCVVPPSDPNALAAAIRNMTPRQCADMRPAVQSLKRSFSWEGLAGAIWDEPLGGGRMHQ